VNHRDFESLARSDKEVGMKRTAILVGIGLLGLAYSGICSFGGRSTAEDKVLIKPAPSQETGPAWAEELNEIRRQLGGGALEGSLLESPRRQSGAENEGEFLKELERLSEQVAPPVGPVDAFQAPRRPDLARDAVLVGALRQTARLLDEKANWLELENGYDQADQYRKLAGRLRRESRRLDAPEVGVGCSEFRFR
jgi:hypothetical protein